MFLDSDGAPGGGGGDKPGRIEIVTPRAGVLLQLTPQLAMFNVGLACCEKNVSDDELLVVFRSIIGEDDHVKWSRVVRESLDNDADYNKLLPRCCVSDPNRLRLAVLATVTA